MARVRWEPGRELTALQSEMNRVFNGFFDTQTRSLAGGRWLPAMDVLETDQHYLLRADLPGVAEEDVSIELEGDVLTIAGERRSEHEAQDEGFYRLERAQGRFSRSLTLPGGIDADAIKAEFERGVLEVRVPKPEQRKARRVQIAARSR